MRALSRLGELRLRLLAHAQPAITRLEGYLHAGKKEGDAANCDISRRISRHKEREGMKGVLAVFFFFFFPGQKEMH